MFNDWEEGFVVGSLMGLNIEHRTIVERVTEFVVGTVIDSIYSVRAIGPVSSVHIKYEGAIVHPKPEWPSQIEEFTIGLITSAQGDAAFNAFSLTGGVATKINTLIGEVVWPE